MAFQPVQHLVSGRGAVVGATPGGHRDGWIEVEFGHVNHGPQRPPMTKTNMDLSELPAKQDRGDFLRSFADAVLQLIIARMM
ncbi:hypothetical protein [Mangrovicoccus ximenensis]|uniref:hypothetical protein n=1 Tax=Mangrovicoccus ximenensis TaxID=1911570 RepID=UPI0011AEBEC3|nr:hypothetical protein [Mangrovicoccus ximenensis]